MAFKYVWSGATGTANGNDWANAYLTMQGSNFNLSAGDTCYVAHDHSELTGGYTINYAVNAANPCKVVCVNRFGSFPPVLADRRATAVIACSGNGAVAFGNPIFVDGLILIAGNSTGAAVIQVGSGPGHYRFDNCSFRLGSTGNSRIQISAAALYNAVTVEFNNTTAVFSGIGQGFDIKGALFWRNTPNAVSGNALPTFLFGAVTSGIWIDCVGVDFSAMGVSKTILDSSVACGVQAKFRDCKFDPAVTKVSVPPSPGAIDVEFLRCATATQNYAIQVNRSTGLLLHETTVVRDNGATDGNTRLSWKIATTVNTHFTTPFDTPQIAVWNNKTGSPVTATIEGMWGGSTVVPLDSEVWVETEYLGDTAPQGSFATDGPTNTMTAAVAQAASAATWSGGVVSLAAWNPADLNNVNLTNNNLRATVPSGTGGARGMAPKSAGKHYWEYVYTTLTTNSIAVGVSLAAGSLTSPGVGVAYLQRSTGNIVVNGTGSGSTLGLIPTSAVIGVALDIDAKLIWFRVAPSGNWNGNASADPATGIGGVNIASIATGPLYPFMTGQALDAITANFGASGFTGPLPANGFYSGWLGGAGPTFKLETTFTPRQPGWVFARVKVGKPSTTVYIDPMVTLS